MNKPILLASLGIAGLMAVGCASSNEAAKADSPAAQPTDAAKPAEGSCGAHKAQEGSCGGDKAKDAAAAPKQ